MAFPNFLTAWRASGRGGDVYNKPREFRTPFSSSVNGMTTIDPTIRRSQDEALTTYLGQNAETRKRFTGNQSAFRQARVDPMQRQMAMRRSEIQQDQGLRKISGSSFAQDTMTGFDADSQRSIGEASAQAEMEDLQALAGLDQASLEATLNLRAQQYAQELAALGMSRDQINMEMHQFNNEQARKLAQVQNYNQTLNTTHKLVTDWGDFSSMTGGGSTPSAGCYIAAFHFGTWTREHYVIARHVHSAKTWKAKIARVIYMSLYPLFKSLLKEATNGRT